MTEERYRHKKRGSTYTVIARWFFQVDGDLDNEKVVVYRGEDGRVWVRPEYEFNDGRFERLPDEVTELNGPILKYISRDAKRETFEVPEGYEAVRDADGRATGEVRKVDPTTAANVEVGQQPIGWTWELGIRREATGLIYRWEPQIGFHMPELNDKTTRNLKALYALAGTDGSDNG